MEKYSHSGFARGTAEPDSSEGKKKRHSPFHAILLVGILSGWVGSICLYAFGATGQLRVSVLIIISAMWMIAFFSVGSATLRK